MSTRPFDRFKRRRSPEHIIWRFPAPSLIRLTIRASLVLALISATFACGSPHPTPPTPDTPEGGIRDGGFDADEMVRLARLEDAVSEMVAVDLSSGLLVRLAFDDVADLDLFVTDPLQESVYFANSPTHSGGWLIQDRRCIDPAPRVEQIHFARPGKGRYRVGVDFHARCDEASGRGATGRDSLYTVRVEEGGRVLTRSGRLAPGHFEIIVIEFEVQ